MTEILEGMTIVDFSTGWPGSIATMVLSDFGAEVIKVEPPTGDPYRAFPQSSLWNRGKKSLVLDMETEEGLHTARSLIKKSDVLVESFSPGEADSLGIGYGEMSASRADLVYCSITAFGPKGRYAKYKPYEGIVAAKAGRYTVFTGQTRRSGPHYGAVQIASHGTAMAAIRGIVAALIVRDKTGIGQKVDTSLIQGISPYDINNWLIWQMMIKFPDMFQDDPQSNPDRLPGIGYQPIRTKDGQWIQMANLIPRLFRASMEAMGLGDVLKDERFEKAPTLMPDDREDLRSIIVERGLEKTMDEWMDIFVNQTANVAAEPYLTTQQGMQHPQVLHNKHVVDVEDPELGIMRQLGVLVRMDKTPGRIQGPAPRIGEHTSEILDSLGDRVEGRSYANVEGGLPNHPLSGFTLLDLSTVIAGPLATSLTYELGVRVIRIETLEGDTTRRNFDGLGANRTQAGAENISINLQTPEGKEIFRKLVVKADMLVHNMRPGAPERLGIGYDQVREINPRIVYLYAGGYGDSGPHSHRPAMHPIGGAVIGGARNQMGQAGLPSDREPMNKEEINETARRLSRANETNPDPNSSMVISAGVLLGLYARERHGVPQYILSTMLGANAYANADDFFDYDTKPDRQVPDREGHGTDALNRLYETQSGWAFLACRFEDEWQNLCEGIGRKDLIQDIRFSTSEARWANNQDLSDELKRIFISRAARDWETILSAVNVACVEAEDSGMFHFFSQDSHIEENEFIRPVQGLRIGSYWRYGPVVGLSRTPSRVGPGPLRGQHTESLMREIGYSDDSIQDLRDRQVIGWEEPTVWGEAGH